MADDTAAPIVRERIRHLLGASLAVSAEHMDGDLVDAGVIDSADFMELFLLLEDAFGIEIGAADLVLENFRTIERMAAFVLSKQAARTGSAAADLRARR